MEYHNVYLKIYISNESTFIHNILHNILLEYSMNGFIERSIDNLSNLTIEKSINSKGILGIIDILGFEFLIIVEKVILVGTIFEFPIFRIEKITFLQCPVNTNFTPEIKDQITKFQEGIEAYISTGFYYSEGYDLTNTIQDIKKDGLLEIENKYIWNYELVMNMIKGNEINIYEFLKKWCLVAICGYIFIDTCLVGAEVLKLILISRRSKNYAGTRYLTRGIDDNGKCGNFVETEQIFIYKENLFAHFQIRGQAPIFFYQIPPLYNSTEIVRDLKISMPHFNSHIIELIKDYYNVSIVNLLGDKDHEKIVSTTFEIHYNIMRSNLRNKCDYFYYDFHNKCKNDNFENLKEFLEQLNKNIIKYGFFHYKTNNQTIISEQKGVFRTNCMDCLDRTNVLQTRIAHAYLKLQIASIEFVKDSKLINIIEKDYSIKNGIMKSFKYMWADNGDVISIQFCGTVSNITSVTKNGSRGIWGYISGTKTSLERILIGNISDEFKQKCIDCLLQNYQFRKNICKFSNLIKVIS